MPFRYRAIGALILGIVLVAMPMLPAVAAETESSELVIITETDVVFGDLYAVANRIIIRGRVEGDLIALAGQDVRVEGEVTGSVVAMAAEVVVTGSIGGSLRSTAPSVEISGQIGRDVFVAAGGFSLKPGSIVGGDVVVWAWNAEVLGSVGGGLEGSQRNVELAGEILGDVEISARKVSVVNGFHVGGDLGYRSANEADGIELAEVDGVVVQKDVNPANIRLRALGLVARVLTAFMLTAVSLLVAWGWPDRTQKSLDSLRQRPLRSFLTGGVVMLSPLLLVGLAILLFQLTPATAALPLILILAPLIIATLGIVLIVAVVAGIPTAAWLGNLLAKKTTLFGAIAIGSAVVAVIWLLPVVGWLVPLVMLTGGLGGWIGTFRPVETQMALPDPEVVG